MKPAWKSLALAGAQLALILSLGGKLLVDRATRPRFWLKAAPVDPDLPIRGRYVSLRVEVPVTGATLPPVEARPKDWPERAVWPPRWRQHHLRVELREAGSALVAVAEPIQARPRPVPLADMPNAVLPERMRSLPEAQWSVVLDDPVAFFIPEHAPDPSRRAPGEELWVEVTWPRKGPLRPIRLAVRTATSFRILPG